MIFLQLFWSFLQVGLFSVGGGYAALPLIQNQMVDVHGWITLSEFSDLITIAEMTPGPIAINGATFVGIRCAGLPGAIVATFGCIFPSCVIVSLFAFLYARYSNLSVVQSVLATLRPVVVALIASAGISILQQAVFSGRSIAVSSVDWIAGICFAAAFLAIRKTKINPVIIMLVCGVIYAAVQLLLGR